MTAIDTALSPQETQTLVLELLTRAAAAHGVYEATVLGGRHHDEWPDWYADHMVSALDAAGYRIVDRRP